MAEDENKRGKKSLIWRISKWIMGIFLGVVALILIILTLLVWYMQPERLTPLVEKVANENLYANVKIARVELTFWSTFPRLEVDVQGVHVVSNTLKDIKTPLHSGADSLLRMQRLHAAINLWPLVKGKIALRDVIIDRPWVNLVQATDTKSNWDIVPPSTDEEPFEVPDFSIGTFKITGGMPISYRSLVDSTQFSVNLNTTTLTGQNAPDYSLEINGFTSAQLANVKIEHLHIGVGGKIHWNHKQPNKIELEDFSLGVGDVNTVTSMTLDMKEQLTVENMSFSLPLTPVKNIIALIPPGMRGDLAGMSSEGSLAFDMNLTKPYQPGINPVPTMDVALRIPGGRLDYGKVKLHDLQLDLTGHLDGENFNNSTLRINRFHAEGGAMNATISADVSNVWLDPIINGSFHGHLNISQLPEQLLKKIPAKITGQLTADCDFHLRKSYLTPRLLHKIRLDGSADLSNFRIRAPLFQAGLFINQIAMKLGTTGSYKNAGVQTDSLFSASIKLDTIAFHAPGMKLEGRGLDIGMAALNTYVSSDTSQINPIGGRISLNRLTLISETDSTRIFLKEGEIAGALRRYNGHARRPLLDLVVKAKRAGYRDPMKFASLKGLDMKVTLHPGTPRIGPRMRARMDSVTLSHPNWSDEQVYLEARRLARSNNTLQDVAATGDSNSGTEKVDLAVEGGLRNLLRYWDVRGHLNSERVRFFTPYFPLKTLISDVKMDFNTDSVLIHDTKVRLGESDFTVNGSITNISRALTSRKGNKPLEINFDVTSNYLDINQLAAAVFAGSAFSEKEANAFQPLTLAQSEQAWEQAVNTVAPIDSVSAFVVPMNIDATLNLRSKNVLYSDFVFHDLTGSLMMFDGQINLHKLSASTDIGRANISALYTAPNKQDLSFAFGMQLNDFRISRAMSMIPALDSVMPILKDIQGIVNANVAATTRLDQAMNLDIPSLSAAIKISGDSLVLLDAETFKKVSKWLLFKNKKRNMIDHMSMEFTVDSSQMQVYPFIFDIDRYKLGISGSNDLAMNYKYHVAVLKSPIPFRFGINLSGNPDKMKIRLGRAKFNEKNIATTVQIADTTRINLVNQIENIFRRGVKKGGIKKLRFGSPSPTAPDLPNDTISAADSLYFRQQGLELN